MKAYTRVVAVSLGAGCLASLLIHPLIAGEPVRAQAAKQGGEVGRYNLVVTPPTVTGNVTYSRALYVIDTKTGRIWVRSSDREQWQTMASPVR